MIEKFVKLVLVILCCLSLFFLWTHAINFFGYKAVFFYQLEPATMMFAVLCCVSAIVVAYHTRIGTK